ncbi:MAG: hypothetical protein KDC84_00990 [Crocinitomicaceae bacterium]|nr:hypothetical protein [Crocinitomicaceae bacterium]
MKSLKICLSIILFSSFLNAQEKKKDKLHIELVFWDSIDGWMFGLTNKYDLNTYSIGVEGKWHLSMWGVNEPWAYTNGYAGYKHLFTQNSGISESLYFGLSLYCISLENSFYFGKSNSFLWTVTPKLGLDFGGNLSFYYGYQLPIINKSEFSWKDFHVVQISYHIEIESWRR